MFVGALFKVFAIFLQIILLVYLVAQAWIIFVDLQVLDPDYDEEMLTFKFNDGWNIRDEEMNVQTIILLYYSLTTLITTGLGDFYPITSYERIICSIIFLCGVTIFSYVLNQLKFTLIKGGLFKKSEEYEEQIGQFFGLLRHLNGNQPINKQLM